VEPSEDREVEMKGRGGCQVEWCREAGKKARGREEGGRRGACQSSMRAQFHCKRRADGDGFPVATGGNAG